MRRCGTRAVVVTFEVCFLLETIELYSEEYVMRPVKDRNLGLTVVSYIVDVIFIFDLSLLKISCCFENLHCHKHEFGHFPNDPTPQHDDDVYVFFLLLFATQDQ